jgi:hypothetical protein
MLTLLMGDAPVVVRSKCGLVSFAHTMRRLGWCALLLWLAGCAALNEPVEISGGASAVTDAPNEAFEVTGSVRFTVQEPGGARHTVTPSSIRSYRFGITRYIVRTQQTAQTAEAASPEADDLCEVTTNGAFKCTLNDSSGDWTEYVLEGRVDGNLSDDRDVRCFASQRFAKTDVRDVTFECSTMVVPQTEGLPGLAGQVFGLSDSYPGHWAEVHVRQSQGTQSCLVQPFTGHFQCGTLPEGDYTLVVRGVEPFTGCGRELDVSLPLPEQDRLVRVQCEYPFYNYLPIVTK